MKGKFPWWTWDTVIIQLFIIRSGIDLWEIQKSITTRFQILDAKYENLDLKEVDKN